MQVKKLLMLCCAGVLSLCALMAHAEEVKYKLYVGGKQVTSTNAANITDWVTEGKVSYDDATKTLTLDNAKIESSQGGIWNEDINGLKIVVKGKCQVSSGYYSSLDLDMATTVLGTTLADELTLYCSASGLSTNSAIDMSNSCTVRDCSVVIECSLFSVGGGYLSTHGKSLQVENAKISIKGNGAKVSLGYLAALRLKGCQIVKPKGAKFDVNSHCVVVVENGQEKEVTGDVVIEAVAIVKVTDITLTPTEAKLEEGQKVNLTAKVIPDNATEQGLVWSSSNPQVATVSQAGEVEAIRRGTCKITVKSLEDGSSVEKTCEITVNGPQDNRVPVTSVVVSPTQASLPIGGKLTLSGKVLPDNATEQSITWKSLNTMIAIVSQAGEVVGISAGTCKVVAICNDNGEEKRGECDITVSVPGAPGQHGGAVEDVVLAGITVSPNPFGTQLRIENPEGVAATYELLTVTGRSLRVGALATTEVIVDTEELPAGLYFVRIKGANNATKTLRVVRY